MTSGRIVLDALMARRSVRSGFTDEPVAESDVERIVAAGLAAPSSKNAQPWRLHVVVDPGLRAALADAVDTAPEAADYVPHDPSTGRAHPQYRSTVAESAQTVWHAPVAIWVANLGPFSGGRRALERAAPAALAASLEGYGFELIGIGAAIENMWVAATALGLAASFAGDVVIGEQRIRPLLGLRGDLVGVVLVGHSTAPPVPPMDARALPDLDRVVRHRAAPPV